MPGTHRIGKAPIPCNEEVITCTGYSQCMALGLLIFRLVDPRVPEQPTPPFPTTSWDDRHNLLLDDDYGDAIHSEMRL